MVIGQARTISGGRLRWQEADPAIASEWGYAANTIIKNTKITIAPSVDKGIIWIHIDKGNRYGEIRMISQAI